MARPRPAAGPARPASRCARSRRAPSRRPRSEAGAVTAETAVLLPALVLLLAVLLAAAAAGVDLIRYEEAARASARAAARGESTAVVRTTALRLAGDGAAVAVARDARTTTVTVSGPAPGVLGQWGGWRLSAEASAATEAPPPAGSPGG
ncbi:TadE family type IV pilus minor pilin [Kocuria flava]|uniref:TadE family type IV pilus minor pilin n=1 Tax=Kocuria flava TaxID=446860 RepID=UPI003F1BEA3D